MESKIGVTITECDGAYFPLERQPLPTVTDFNSAKYILCNFGIPVMCADLDGARPPQIVTNLEQAEEFFNSYPHEESEETVEETTKENNGMAGI